MQVEACTFRLILAGRRVKPDTFSDPKCGPAAGHGLGFVFFNLPNGEFANSFFLDASY